VPVSFFTFFTFTCNDRVTLFNLNGMICFDPNQKGRRRLVNMHNQPTASNIKSKVFHTLLVSFDQVFALFWLIRQNALVASLARLRATSQRQKTAGASQSADTAQFRGIYIPSAAWLQLVLGVSRGFSHLQQWAT
jgi:hypothetical protein